MRFEIYLLVNTLNKELFEEEAETLVNSKLTALKTISFDEAMKLPRAVPEDIVIAGKEVQLTVFKQSDLEDLPDAVLVTLQVVRAGLGGILNYQLERGMLYFPNGDIREATEKELLATR